MNKISVGYQAICEQLKLEILPHYCESYIALQGREKTLIEQHHEIHIYPRSYALRDNKDLLSISGFYKNSGILIQMHTGSYT